jgi:NAD(P)-dependent dehydrogenase (short-subunit alcohol dehydrogenase family)/uncharacterized protein YndB with AHSA1/START domain
LEPKQPESASSRSDEIQVGLNRRKIAANRRLILATLIFSTIPVLFQVLPSSASRAWEAASSLKMTPRESGFEGQVAVVTGGGRGIGRAIALALAAAGAMTAVLARSQSELVQTVAMNRGPPGRMRAFPVDVTSADAIRKVFCEVEDQFGPVSVLVNNAGTLGPIGPFTDTSIEECWRTFDVNLRGPMLCTHVLLPGMVRRRHGRIINIASSAIPIAYFSSYATSKTALIRFTEILAAETACHGVSMFSVGPGTVRTAMSDYSLNSAEGKKWLPWFKKIFDQGLDVPVERPVELVLTLASGSADVLSGRHISVSDDLDSLLGNVEQIERGNLLTLRIGTLDSSCANSSLAAIRAEAGRSAGLTLHLERTFAAPRDEVFQAWTHPELVKRWFVHSAGVRWMSAPQMDVRAGGSYAWKVVSNSDARDTFQFRGIYRNVESPRELAFTWDWQALPIQGVEGPGHTLVTIRLESLGEGTQLLLAQQGFPTEAARAAHDRGWQRCFDGIGALLANKQ